MVATLTLNVKKKWYLILLVPLFLFYDFNLYNLIYLVLCLSFITHRFFKEQEET